MAFLDGAPPERLCQPVVDYIRERGGEVRMQAGIRRIETAPDGRVTGFKMADGSSLQADAYMSAMPVDIVKKLVPEPWADQPFFRYIC